MFRPFAVTLLAAMLLPFALGADDADDAPIDRVEEDWELVIASPAPGVTCPQVSTSMSPDAGASSTVMAFNLNYRETPSFQAGGLEVKILNGDQAVASDSQGSAQFQTDGETVTWTQRLNLAGGSIHFKVVSGKSTTWGDFGDGDNDLAVAVPTSRTSLAGYSPDTSVRNSGPSFGPNRVTRMTLLGVRYYRGNTLVSTDTTPRPVDLSN